MLTFASEMTGWSTRLLMAALASVWLAGTVELAAGPPERYAVDVLTAEDGLPQSSVVSLAQTRDGYIWLGTLGGLARFDGVNFTVFDEGNTPQLDSSRVVRVFEDSRTNLWVATETGGLLRVDAQGRVLASGSDAGWQSSGRVLAFAEDSAGGVWLYRADGQLACYSDRMRVWNVDKPTGNRRLLAPDDGRLVWLGTQQGLLAVGPVPIKSGELPIARQEAVDCDFLVSSKKGGHWRFAGGHISRHVGDRVVEQVSDYPWPANVFVTAACEDLEGHLVVGTYGDPGAGVYWFNKEGKPVQLKGLSHSSVLSLLIDREGTLWVGTDGGGLNHVRKQAFSVVGDSLGSTVQSVCGDGRDGLWIGYNGARVEHWGRSGTKQYTVSKAGASMAVRSVYRDMAGRVWAGTLGGGLFWLEGEQFVPASGYEEVGNARVSAIFEDKERRMWIGTQGGLARQENGQWRTFSSLQGLAAGPVQAIAQDASGAIWAGTDGGGLSRIADGGVTNYTKAHGLRSDKVYALCVDGAGRVWAGTSSGLCWFDGAEWHSPANLPLPGNSIRFVMDDAEGNLWVGSNRGITRSVTESLRKSSERMGAGALFRNFGIEDGLPTLECTQGSQPAACRTADGSLYFATIKGVASVANRDVAGRVTALPVVIDGLIIDGRPIITNHVRMLVPGELKLRAPSKSVEIHFASLNMSDPRRTRYRYRLLNHDADWTEGMGSRGVSSYARLPAGDYRFELMAAGEAGAWGNAGAAIGIRVLPPFWQTWWFILVTSAVILGGVVGMVHYLSTQRLQRQLAVMRQQEALERERGRIARDLHDQLGANLTQVALLGELAEADKHLPEEVESHAKQISHTARETTRALDEIVWTVNPANDTLEGLANYVCKYAQEYLVMAGLKHRIDVPAQLPDTEISPELRHNAFLVAKEAINNVVKHAKANSVHVRLEVEDGKLLLEIRDDGVGIPEGAENKGRNGLKNMRSRMEEVGGSFSVTPNAGGGTISRLEAPLKSGKNRAVG